METINDRIRRLRIRCEKSQEEFGKILGLTRSGICDIENGRRDVNERHIIMLSNWTERHVNIDWLRNGGSDDDMFKVEYETDELSDFCAEISDGKDPFIADMLLKYKRLSPAHKKAIWEIYEELQKKEED